MLPKPRKGRRVSKRRLAFLIVLILFVFAIFAIGFFFYHYDVPSYLGDGNDEGGIAEEREQAGVWGPRQNTAPPRTTGGEGGAGTVSPPPASPDQQQQPEEDRRTIQPNMYGGGRASQRFDGAYLPEESERLPGLSIHRRTYTPEELLTHFGDSTIIYSFINGSEANHEYRKEVRVACMKQILAAEQEAYERHGIPGFLMPVSTEPTVSVSLPPSPPPLSFSLSPSPTGTTVEGEKTFAKPPETPFDVLGCRPSRLRSSIKANMTLGRLLADATAAARSGADNRDRETDELRHSIRSLEQHVQWHRGRVVIVSPGHHPTWVDGARNFLAGTCGGAAVQALRARGTHLRLTTVHQDAVMPYGEKLTGDSHVVEQHIWRVKNTTPVHVYMNDDYFVNRDVAITDLFNEYGGTIVRVEAGVIGRGAVADDGVSWAKGVSHAQQFNINELDVHHEDYLPERMLHLWADFGRLGVNASPTATLPILKDASTNDAVNVARKFPPEPMPSEQLRPRRARYYATHAPFVYCTNMFRFFNNRYEREFANNSLLHRSRKARDYFLPFLYNAFIMARPWQASPQFLPYVLQLFRSRQWKQPEIAPRLNITLDNCDGCAPATLLAGGKANGCLFAKFMNNESDNAKVIGNVAYKNPLYFNINAGFNSPAAAAQLRSFLHDKFPTPVFLEAAAGEVQGAAQPEDAGAVAGTEHQGDGDRAKTEPTPTREESDRLLSSTFDALMQLPVIGLVSYDEGVCPLVRSLSLAFANHHKGRVHVRVQPHGDGDMAATLRETRYALQHPIVSAVPVPQCAYNSSAVHVSAEARDRLLADIVVDVLSNGSGVELPSTCGAASGTAGLRVRGFVIDARTLATPLNRLVVLPEALAMPGQTLALEDFRAVHVGPGERDVVLVLARADADAKAVHWITGASESDLLLTYPVPVEAYEDMDAVAQWAQP